MIINIILLFLFIATLIKPTTGYLMCGIFAWVGKNPKLFSAKDFNILGNYNDSRGGDSCGVLYDGESLKGMNKLSKYKDLVREHELHNIKLTQPLIIGHTRKASVGTITEVNTQPIELVAKAGDTEIVYAHAHNGTITNHEELAKKYKIGLKHNESDSIALAKLIYNCGFGILSEYVGTAALVIYFKDQPGTLYVFRGRSKPTHYGVLTDERPLYYMNVPGKGTFISSIEDSLDFISPRKDVSPVEFAVNTLYKLENNSVEIIDTYDRTLLVPDKSVSSSVTCNTAGYNYTNRNVHSTGASQHYSNTGTHYGVSALRDLKLGGTPPNKLYYTNGAYYHNNKLAHGIYTIDEWGYTFKDSNSKYQTWEAAFYYGMLLKDVDYFERLTIICENHKIEDVKSFFTYHNFEKLDGVLRKFTSQPYGNIVSAISDSVRKPDLMGYTGTKVHYFSGEYKPVFSKFILTISLGEYRSHREDTITKTWTVYQEDLGNMLRAEAAENYSHSDEHPYVDVECPECNGYGVKYLESRGYYDDCDTCWGSGKILKTDYEFMMADKDRIEDVEPEDDSTVTTKEIMRDILKKLSTQVDTAINEIEIADVKKFVEDEYNDLIEIKTLIGRNL